MKDTVASKALDRIVELEAELAAERERWILEREVWIRQKAECVTLQEQLVEERARLDWCAEHGAMAVTWWDGGYRVVNNHNVWMTDVHDTPRAAIDDARSRP